MDELDKLLSHSFEEIKQNGDLIIKLLQLSKNFLNLSYTDCEKQHRSYYEKLKTIKNTPMGTLQSGLQNYLHKKYILRGLPLYYNGNHFNNDTLTDRIAASAIKRFPNLIGRFLSEKERAILEAMVKGTHDITDAENALTDEQFEDQIIVLIDAEKFDEARELVPKLLVEETREAALAAIDDGEEKVIEAAEEAEKIRLAGIQAQKDTKEAENKRLADEEAKAEQEARDKKAKALKAEAEKKIADEAKKVEDEKAKEEKLKKEEATKKKKNNAK